MQLFSGKKYFQASRVHWATLLCLLMSGAPAAALSADAYGVAELTRATIDQHPSLRGASAKVGGAQANLDAAKWQFWPTPSLGVEGLQSSSSNQTQVGDKNVGVFRLQQPLWTGGRLTQGLKRAEAAVLVAQAESNGTRQSLALQVIEAWSDAVVSIRKIDAQKASLETHLRLQAMVERRLAEGASAQSDSMLALSRIDAIRAEIQLLLTRRDSALDKLRLLTKLDLNDRNLIMSHKAHAVVQRSLTELLDQAKEQSPQVLRARYAVEVARADAGVAKSALMPEVALRYEYQAGNFNAINVPNESKLFVTLNTSFGAGLSTMAGVNSALAQLDAATQEVAVQEQALYEQVQLDHSLIHAAQARVLALTAAKKAADEVFESYERQFLAGRKQWLDLMNAAREQAQSLSQLADALGALELSRLRLLLMVSGVDELQNVTPMPTTGWVVSR
jgi:adhesin transport system outer membrane protein